VRSKWASFAWFLLALSGAVASSISLFLPSFVPPPWSVLGFVVNTAMAAWFALDAVAAARAERRRP
jgi:hypothetical protein